MAYEKSTLHVFYDDYEDDEDLSIVNADRTITMNYKGKLVEGDKNSQIIGFKCKRFFDGIDLSTKKIKFHVVNCKRDGIIVDACNVKYDDEEIIFHLLCDEYVTSYPCKLMIEILFCGETSAGEYVFKTYENKDLKVEHKLYDNEAIVPKIDWIDKYLSLTGDVKDEFQKIIEDKIDNIRVEFEDYITASVDETKQFLGIE